MLPRVSTAVCSSYKVLYHQAHINDRKTGTYGKRSLNSHTERYSKYTHNIYMVALVNKNMMYTNVAVEKANVCVNIVVLIFTFDMI